VQEGVVDADPVTSFPSRLAHLLTEALGRWALSVVSS
jgi:hypothetical protein